jgi:hypothetical protein
VHTKTWRQAAVREALEGSDVPDLSMTGVAAHLPADIVIVSARRKPGWDRGTVVLTERGCFRIGTPVERTIGGRLRTLYPLTEHRDLEVIRRSVTYTLPNIPHNS